MPGRVKELVSDLSPALNRLSGMRGLAARVVAVCDDEFRTVLLHWGTDPEVEAELVESIKEKAQAGSRRQRNRAAEIANLGDLLDDPVSSSGVLFKEVYTRVGELEVRDEVKATRYELRQYGEKVLAVRNTLAHVLEEPTADGWRIPRRRANPALTVQDFERFRADFQAHLRHVRQLREFLVG